MKKLVWMSILFFSVSLYAGDSLSTVKSEIIYGRKDGMALTLVMEQPEKNSNGRALVNIISGNWRSGIDQLNRLSERNAVFLKEGFTVFAVIPSSQPRYTIPDEVEDVKRAVRFIRFHAKEYKIDPDKIGITGASSGGHLALMIATADDLPVKNQRDPVDTVSSRVQAAAVFYPPTDFLNYGQEGFSATATQALLVATGLAAAFDFKKWDESTRTYISIPDIDTRKEIARQNSPIYAVSADDPPVMIIHGDADRLVPLQQSESLIKKLEAQKVPNKLIIKSGGGHGWRDTADDEQAMLLWFLQYLK